MADCRRQGAFLLRWFPVAVVIAATLGAALLGGTQLSFVTVSQHFVNARSFVETNLFVAVAAFTLLYAAIIGFAVFAPSSPMTILGGMLFGPWLGGLACLIAKVSGGVVALLIWRNAFRSDLERLHPRINNLTWQIEREGFRHLLAIRLLPILPFGLVTVGAATAKIDLRAFIAATAIGQIPAILLYTFIGAGAGRLIGSGRTVDLAGMTSLKVLAVPLALMTGVAILMFMLQWRRSAGRRDMRWVCTRSVP